MTTRHEGPINIQGPSLATARPPGQIISLVSHLHKARRLFSTVIHVNNGPPLLNQGMRHLGSFINYVRVSRGGGFGKISTYSYFGG